MPNYIICRGDAYNIYSTIVDAPLFKEAATLEMLTNWYALEYGQHGLRDLPERLERAHAKGTSCINDRDLEDCITLNRAGENESELTFDELVARYLTLPAKEMTEQEAVELAESGWWKEATAVEIVRRQLFEERSIMNMGDFQLALDIALGHPVFTSALGSKASVEAMKKEFISLHGEDPNA
jgi:hypothetical protein